MSRVNNFTKITVTYSNVEKKSSRDNNLSDYRMKYMNDHGFDHASIADLIVNISARGYHKIVLCNMTANSSETHKWVLSKRSSEEDTEINDEELPQLCRFMHSHPSYGQYTTHWMVIFGHENGDLIGYSFDGIEDNIYKLPKN